MLHTNFIAESLLRIASPEIIKDVHCYGTRWILLNTHMHYVSIIKTGITNVHNLYLLVDRTPDLSIDRKELISQILEIYPIVLLCTRGLQHADSMSRMRVKYKEPLYWLCIKESKCIKM